jgi:hypothetical protein
MMQKKSDKLMQAVPDLVVRDRAEVEAEEERAGEEQTTISTKEPCRKYNPAWMLIEMLTRLPFR